MHIKSLANATVGEVPTRAARSRTVVIDAALRQRLADAITKHGERAVAAHYGVTVGTIARAAAGFGVLSITAALLSTAKEIP